MGITRKIWVRYHKRGEVNARIAIVGASGLRSVGKIVIEELVQRLKPQLLLELYSYGLPGIYYGPSYLASPSGAGVIIDRGGMVKLPGVKFYVLNTKNSERVIIVDGYQAYSSINQYMIADKVTDLLVQQGVKRLFSLGAQVIENGLRCCATDLKLLDEMRGYGINKTRVDRFIGFSGLVAAIGQRKGMESICLFAPTDSNTADPEYPDYRAATELLTKLGEILKLEVDTSILEARSRAESERIAAMLREEEERSAKERREREREESQGYV